MPCPISTEPYGKSSAGVEDDGNCKGLTEEELAASISTLKHMAEQLNAHVTILRRIQVRMTLLLS